MTARCAERPAGETKPHAEAERVVDPGLQLCEDTAFVHIVVTALFGDIYLVYFDAMLPDGSAESAAATENLDKERLIFFHRHRARIGAPRDIRTLRRRGVFHGTALGLHVVSVASGSLILNRIV